MTARPGGAPFSNGLPKSVTDEYEAAHEAPKTAALHLDDEDDAVEDEPK